MSFVFERKIEINSIATRPFGFGTRRGVVINIDDALEKGRFKISDEQIQLWEKYDLIYRTLCGILYNFVPQSGHPGGSISSGRMVAGIIFNTMDYDFSQPNRKDSDIISYAAGHKAMGLYAMWALRNEVVRISKPELLPGSEKLQLRLEDLVGFRRNPTHHTPLFKKLKAKPLDGHPTPATPHVRLSTGASGVGVPSSLGLALGAMDTFRKDPPRVHLIEGEGGMTPGRVHEALAGASAARLWNAIMHVDWNQASIDSNSVCREGDEPGEYVQWDPIEIGYLHDWNCIVVKDGIDFKKVLAAQQVAIQMDNKQPTMVIYKTIKGWQYGIEGRKSHGAGHKFCSEDYYKFLKPFEEKFGVKFPRFEGEKTDENIEAYFYRSLMMIRQVLESEKSMVQMLATGVEEARQRLNTRGRKPDENGPKLEIIYAEGTINANKIPEEVKLAPGGETTLRATLGKVLGYLNKLSKGAIIGSAADLLDSTSVSKLAEGFPPRYFNAVSNPEARLIPVGGICEDAMGAFMSGLSAFGFHIGVTSSYGAFIAALEHIAARLHGIGQQMKKEVVDEPYNTWIMVNAHTGIKTGEDGPTHADPQCLQLLQENFPKGVLITLTPWDPAEIWPLMVEGLLKRPAILAPFVTRPNEKIFDRKQLRLPDPSEGIKGIYAMRKADMSYRQYNGTVVLQGSGVTNTFVEEVLPRLDKEGLNINIYYVTSAELFELLPEGEKNKVYPIERAAEAMGITGFTMPTMHRWVISPEGRRTTLFPHKAGRYLGSGKAHKVLEEANLHGEGQFKTIMDYARQFEKRYRQDPQSIYTFKSC